MGETSQSFSLEVAGSRWAAVHWPVDPGQETRAVVVLIHGLGEYCRRYDALAQQLTALGMATVSFDFWGHGASPGRRGSLGSFDLLLLAVRRTVDWARTRYPNQRLFLLGQSLGGNVATNFALRWPDGLAGIALAAPMFLPRNPPTRWQLRAARWTGRLLPWVRISGMVRPEHLVADIDERSEIGRDPLLHGKMTLRFATQVLEHGRWALDHARQLAVPAIIVHGEMDPLVDIEASHAFAARASGPCEVVAFPDLYHEILRGRGSEMVQRALTDWFDRHARLAGATRQDQLASGTTATT
jgi:alpha-beta hydrolase superfamily lysophospholipase